MKDLTIIVLGEPFNVIKEQNNIEFISANNKNLVDEIKLANSKYLVFVKDDDEISEDYMNAIKDKIKEDFDCCFINYIIKYDYVKEPKIVTNERELKNNKPYYGEYIWSFIFKKEKLVELLDSPEQEFNKRVDELFVNNSAINEVVYYHNPNGKKNIKNFCYNDIKESTYYPNIIYVGKGCNGVFNGYISWIKNIGRCFASKFDITILYEYNMYEPTLENFSKRFKCIKRENNINYVCDRLLVTYSTYFYPKNINYLDENYMFIHGNMSDYPNSRRFFDDVYTKYIAVSKTSALKAKGYFPTDNIEYILNPFKLDDELLKPHLKLVSAQRSAPEKKPERLKIIANALTSLGIPFTWNVFTDSPVNVVQNGIIYRGSIDNPLPYIADSDYFVSLSNSEALSYSVLEALALNTKVIVTPLEAYKELNIRDGENAYIIPFEYLEEENTEKLIELIIEIYINKDRKINYKFDEKLFDGYNALFV